MEEKHLIWPGKNKTVWISWVGQETMLLPLWWTSLFKKQYNFIAAVLL